MINYLKNLRSRIKHRLELAAFRRNGMLPWTPGYEWYRWDTISSVLASGRFNELVGTEKYGYRIDERVVEYPWFFSRLPQGKSRLLDAGSALNHPQLITLPALQEKKLYIATLAPEACCFWNLGISYLYEDLRDPIFKNESFDHIACISTIEHVGLDNTMLYTDEASKAEDNTGDYRATVRRLKKLLVPGGSLYVTFPFGRYVNHGWFQVFNAGMVDAVIEAFAPARMHETIFQYADDRWSVSTRERARDATCFDIHVQKEYDEDFAAFSRGIACLELTK